jgi:hypothetical protein
MDLLGFFKEKICFLELKYVFPFKYPQPHRIPQIRIRCGRAPCDPRVAGPLLAAARDPVRGSCGSARWGPACGRDGIGPATADPGGHAVATPVCGLRYTTPVSEPASPPKCWMECPGEGRGGAEGPHRRRVLRRPGQLVNTERLLGIPRVAGLGGR